jgi:hypothetical protein
VDEKEQMLFTSRRLTIIGTGFLAIGIACSMFLVADVLFGPAAALVVALAAIVVIGALWYALPLIARGRARSSSGGGGTSDK